MTEALYSPRTIRSQIHVPFPFLLPLPLSLSRELKVRTSFSISALPNNIRTHTTEKISAWKMVSNEEGGEKKKEIERKVFARKLNGKSKSAAAGKQTLFFVSFFTFPLSLSLPLFFSNSLSLSLVSCILHKSRGHPSPVEIRRQNVVASERKNWDKIYQNG